MKRAGARSERPRHGQPLYGRDRHSDDCKPPTCDSTGMIQRIRSIGRRGAYLVSKGSLYVIFGLGLIVRGDGPVPDAYIVLQRVAPTPAWGAAWLLAGLIACAAAFMPVVHNRHLSPIAFAGLMAVATIWSLGILSSYVLPGEATGHPWITATLFASLMASTAVVAGWPEEVRS